MTKVISISDDAYTALKRFKAQRSFSQIIIDVMKDRSDSKFISSIGSWDEKTAEKIRKKISEERKIGSRRFS